MSLLPPLVVGMASPHGTASEHRRRALQFSHAVAFLSCALGSLIVPSIEDGVRIILAQVLDRNRPTISEATIGYSRLVAPRSINHCEMQENLDMWECSSTRNGFVERSRECSQDLQRTVRTWHDRHPQRRAAASSSVPQAALCTIRPVRAGDNVLALRAHGTPAAWPFTMGGPLGAPLDDSILPNNIEWLTGLCRDCHCRLLTARAITELMPGDLLRGPRPPATLTLPRQAEPQYQLSFDGGARHRSPNSALPTEGPRAVGAGAALWGPPCPNGRRSCLAQISIAAPVAGCSMLAESLGLRAGLALAAVVLRPPVELRVVGDNLPVMRLAAANGKVRTPGVWETLEAPLLHASVQGWSCSWIAVRRHLNAVADALATLGIHRAVDQAVSNEWTPSIMFWALDDVNVGVDGFPWHPGWSVDSARSPLVSEP